MPHVVIEISRPSAADSNVTAETERALVDACTKAVREGDCVLDRDRPRAPRDVVAIVRWDAEEETAHIELGTHDGNETRWTKRDLTFDVADERLERWRAAGLTVATLSGEAERAKAERALTVEHRVPPESAKSERPPGERLDRPVAPKLWLDLGGLLGSGLDTASPRYGVWADVGFRFGRGPFVGLAGLDYAVVDAPPYLSVQWASLLAGLGAQFGSNGEGPIFEGVAVIAAGREHAAASDGTRSDSGAVFDYGARARAGIVWQLGFVSPMVGAEGWLNAAPVRLYVHDQYAGTAPRAGGGLILGARARIQ